MSKEVVRIADDSVLFGGNGVFETFKYSPAVKAGGLLFVAGQVGLRGDGTAPDDVRTQTDLVFQRIGEILQRCNLNFADLVEVVSYHVDVDKHLGAFRDVKDRYIVATFPTWTIIGVAALARPAFKVEVKCVAAF